MATVKPLQQLSYAEKIKNDKQWGKDNIDYYLSRSNFDIGSSYRSDIQKLYEIYNNEIPEEYFHSVTNPLNSTKKEHQGFPAEVRPINIIIPNVNLYLGEWIKRGFQYEIVNNSPKAYNSYLEGLKGAFENSFKALFYNQLLGQGMNPKEAEQVQYPEKVQEEFESTYTDAVAVKGKGLLKEIEKECEIKDVQKRCFKDYLIAGSAHSYRSVEESEPIYERVNPMDIYEEYSQDQIYGEDLSWQIRRRLVSVADFVDMFYEEAKEEDINKLEDFTVHSSTPYTFHSYLSRLDISDRVRDKFYLFHCVWTSREKIGILAYEDEFGQPQYVEVDETYKLDKENGDISIDWKWVNVKWEGYKVDDDMYFRIREIPYQRKSSLNLSKCKSPYNSIYFSKDNTANTSIVRYGIHYMVLTIIIQYQLELMIRKSDKVVLIDQNVIPSGEDWDEEKFFYFSKATGYALINRDQIGVDKGYNQYQVLDMTMYDNIAQLIQIKDSIKNDYDELLGISRQRKAQVSSSDTVGGTEAAILQSSVISEYIFSSFEGFVLRDYQALLDLTPYVYLDGFKGMVFNDDMRQILLETLPEDFIYEDLGIHAIKSNGGLKEFKQLAQAFAQNGVPPSTILDILESDHKITIRNKLKRVEDIAQQNAQQQAASEQEAELQKMEVEKQFKAFEHGLGLETLNVEQDRLDNRELIKGDVELAKIAAQNEVQGDEVSIQDIEKGNIERQKAMEQGTANRNAETLKSRELDIKEKDVAMKKYQADTQLKIAKENKNSYDTKKK
jgi:hypothetical protein